MNKTKLPFLFSLWHICFFLHSILSTGVDKKLIYVLVIVFSPFFLLAAYCDKSCGVCICFSVISLPYCTQEVPLKHIMYLQKKS